MNYPVFNLVVMLHKKPNLFMCTSNKKDKSRHCFELSRVISVASVESKICCIVFTPPHKIYTETQNRHPVKDLLPFCQWSVCQTD